MQAYCEIKIVELLFKSDMHILYFFRTATCSHRDIRTDSMEDIYVILFCFFTMINVQFISRQRTIFYCVKVIRYSDGLASWSQVSSRN